MKNILMIFSLMLISTQISFGQKKQIIKDTITVDGICEKCKARIQDAAYIKGVKRASWDKTTHKLALIFDQRKASLKAIETSIAKTGHNAGHTKALPKDYNNLPTCCAYKTTQIHH